MNDSYDLMRFIRAQEPVYEDALGALRRGRMCASCMDIIFPRLAPAGGGHRARTYSIASLDEAAAYLSSPILGGRYRQCVATLQGLYGRAPSAVFGVAGTRKLHASLTLFSEAGRAEFVLETMFDAWFDGLVDEETMTRLRQSG